MPDKPMNPAVDDEDPNQSPVEGGKPKVVRREEPLDPHTRADQTGDTVQPGINESSDDPN